jgi:hypothetical protein
MYPPTRVPTRMCRLSLFTWACAESEGKKEVVPMCPKHPAAETWSGTLGTGMMVSCNEGRGHVVGLCSREQFNAEREEAQIGFALLNGEAQ